MVPVLPITSESTKLPDKAHLSQWGKFSQTPSAICILHKRKWASLGFPLFFPFPCCPAKLTVITAHICLLLYNLCFTSLTSEAFSCNEKSLSNRGSVFDTYCVFLSLNLLSCKMGLIKYTPRGLLGGSKGIICVRCFVNLSLRNISYYHHLHFTP